MSDTETVERTIRITGKAARLVFLLISAVVLTGACVIGGLISFVLFWVAGLACRIISAAI